MGIFRSYLLRNERRRYRLRAFRKRRELTDKHLRCADLSTEAVLLFSTIRNGRLRLPYFLEYYRKLGVDHFFIVDNGSDDGTDTYLAAQSDVSVFFTNDSYLKSRFGVDWLHRLKHRFGHGHWCLTVDIDEFLVYPFFDKRPLPALTDWLDASSVRSFGTLMLDTYPKGPVSAALYREGQNPFDVAPWFDGGNYVIEKNKRYWNLWIQGGPRARIFFADRMKLAPALNKIPLVKWHRSYTYVSSTHMLLPRGLNLVFDQRGGEKTSGCLLHAKFLSQFSGDVTSQVDRNQHFANSQEYRAYADGLEEDVDFWTDQSERFDGWQQLEMLGLMSKGNWA